MDILTAPFERQEDKITGSKRGVIVIAIATAKVKASIVSCFWKLTINTREIRIIINLINNLLILSIPFWKLVLGFPRVKVCATFPK